MHTLSRYFSFGLASLSALFLACAATPAIAQERLDSAAAGHAWSGTDAQDPRLVRPEADNGTDGTWSVPFDHPEPRRLHCSVYDPVRRRMIVFGGERNPLDLIWSLSLDDPVHWSHVSVSGPVPATRLGATAIYDPVHDRVLMFGGAISNEVRSNEVWALSLSGTMEWSRLEVTGPAPVDRFLHSAIYDSARNRMIIYGGHHQGTYVGDVWALALDGEPSWTELLPSGPIPTSRRDHAAMYDPIRDRMIIFAGESLGGPGLSDTWELDLSGTPAWHAIVSPEPEHRTRHTLIYDPVGDRAVLLGGWGAQHSGQYGVMHEIWVLPLKGGQWTRTPFFGYLGSNEAPAIYDAGHHRIVVYDGQNAMNIPAVSLVDPQSKTSLLPMPWFHTGQAAIYDPVRERMLMFGGRNQDDLERDTWELSLSGIVKWSRLAAEGFEERLERENHTAIYDPLRDRMVIFGGSKLNETWELRLSGVPTWHQLSPEGLLPDTRGGHTAIYDPRRDRMIVFGGIGSVTSRDDAWALSLAGTPAWSPLPSGPKRALHSAIYDPVGDRMLVFGGGERWYDQPNNEVWSLSLSMPMTWSLLTPAGDAPTPRWGSSAIYDPIRHRVVVFGGCCFSDEKGNGFGFGDAFELSLDGTPKWRALTITGQPDGRRNASMIYDPVGDRAILYGGDGPKDVNFSDVWALTWGEPASPSVSCPASVLPASPLRVSYVVSNSLPTTRGVEWTLTSERDWPGFPVHGFSLVSGSSAETVRLELPIPDTSFEETNTLSFASWFSGAQGRDQSCQHPIPDQATPVLVALASATAEPGRVHLHWNVSTSLDGVASVQRRKTTSEWRTLGPAIVEGGYRLSYEDRDVSPGGTYDYRLAFRRDGSETYAGEARVSVPVALPLALERASQSPKGIQVVLSLPSPDAAKLECFDLAGRRVLGRSLEGLGSGRHQTALAEGDPLASGVYLLRLSQGIGRATLRFVILK